MKRLLVFLTTLAVCFGLLSSPVMAHVLKTDGDIGAVLHIDPADDPIVGQSSSFFFEFKDIQNKFKPELCNCTLAIMEASKQIYTQPLFQNGSAGGLNNALVSFTFPERAVYLVVVTGTPNNVGDFQPFTLTYDIRVSRINSTSKKSPTDVVLAAVFVVVVVGFLVIFLKSRKKPTKTGSKSSLDDSEHNIY